MVLMSVLFLSLHLPLCHLYDCPFDGNELVKDKDENDAFAGGSIVTLVSKVTACVRSNCNVDECVLLVVVHLPLCHLYDCCLTAMEWIETMM